MPRRFTCTAQTVLQGPFNPSFQISRTHTAPCLLLSSSRRFAAASDAPTVAPSALMTRTEDSTTCCDAHRTYRSTPPLREAPSTPVTCRDRSNVLCSSEERVGVLQCADRARTSATRTGGEEDGSVDGPRTFTKEVVAFRAKASAQSSVLRMLASPFRRSSSLPSARGCSL